jgi:hypothetical protein
MRNDSVPFSEYDEGDGRALLRELPSRSYEERRARSAEQDPSEREISWFEES